MFEKNMRLAYLLDFYIDTLDEHSASIMKAYYEDDLSLQEIAEGEAISRQGIRHIIKKSEEKILFLEEKLGLASRYGAIESIVERLRGIEATLAGGKTDEEKSAAHEIECVIEEILNKGV